MRFPPLIPTVTIIAYIWKKRNRFMLILEKFIMNKQKIENKKMNKFRKNAHNNKKKESV